MKIIFLNKYQNRVFRGAETFVYELSSRLSLNHEIRVISDINYLNLLKEKFDLIIPTNGRMQAPIVRIITLVKNAKMVISGQSGMGWDDKINLIVFPDAFVALTDKAAKWAKKLNPYVWVEKIPNGVDLQKFTFRGETLKVFLKKPIILSVGAFTGQKRLDLVIKAVSNLDNVSLLIAGGGGDQKQYLENLGAKLLGNRFRLISVPFEKMPEVYRSADVFTLPSASSEAFGNVYIEAMATNLPVVATADAQRREIIEDAGILVDPTNVNDYARALQKALNTNWGDKPRRQAEKFSWDKITEKYEELFKTLLNEK